MGRVVLLCVTGYVFSTHWVLHRLVHNSYIYTSQAFLASGLSCHEYHPRNQIGNTVQKSWVNLGISVLENVPLQIHAAVYGLDVQITHPKGVVRQMARREVPVLAGVWLLTRIAALFVDVVDTADPFGRHILLDILAHMVLAILALALPLWSDLAAFSQYFLSLHTFDVAQIHRWRHKVSSPYFEPLDRQKCFVW